MVARLNSGVPAVGERRSMCLLKRGFQALLSSSEELELMANIPNLLSGCTL